MALSEDRQEILKKIDEYERQEKWDVDVENDPPAPTLMPNQIDYLNKKLRNKIATKISNFMAVKFFDKQIKLGNLVIEKVNGLENYDKVKDLGVIITCNHFNPFDNYVVFKALQKKLGKKRLWKVIREGNYTNFPGLFGFFFKHCNTIPLSSNTETMKLFMSAVKTLLERKEKILIYPEQAMWWNYKKPRPLKIGAFKFAATNNCPILPCFITMKDSDKIAGDGSFVQKHTLHILPPIFPKEDLNTKENAKYLMEENFEAWKKTYEKVYKKKLEYLK